ncbi:MAG: class I SAM-dependent methyltransferase [Ignavibacteria bacterium]|jgi:SAM-dependent methyltransferase|nr:class I SAM-dependent methyltransferase [Ignavibacteria bacterium]
MPEKCFYDVSNLSRQDVAEYPGFFAKYYDFIYGKIRSNADVDFYLKQINQTAGKVLEVGTGTGRILVEARKSGADIYGIDSSTAMIEVLRGKLPDYEHNRVFVKDARYVNLGIEFDLIIAPFRMFQHLIDIEDQLLFLNNMYNHLKPGGRFIFDVFVPDSAIISNGIDNEVVFDGEYSPGTRLTMRTSSYSDISKQISDITMEFLLDSGEGIQDEKWNSKIRYFYRYELENLVRLSKLKLLNIYGDFRRGEITEDSEDYLVVCEKDFLRL